MKLWRAIMLFLNRGSGEARPDPLRQQVRDAVHGNRNASAALGAVAERRARRSALLTKMAEDALKDIEEARRDGAQPDH